MPKRCRGLKAGNHFIGALFVSSLSVGHAADHRHLRRVIGQLWQVVGKAEPIRLRLDRAHRSLIASGRIRLCVKGVHVAHAAAHVEVDDMLGGQFEIAGAAFGIFAKDRQQRTGRRHETDTEAGARQTLHKTAAAEFIEAEEFTFHDRGRLGLFLKGKFGGGKQRAGECLWVPRFPEDLDAGIQLLFFGFTRQDGQEGRAGDLTRTA